MYLATLPTPSPFIKIFDLKNGGGGELKAQQLTSAETCGKPAKNSIFHEIWPNLDENPFINGGFDELF